MSIMIVIVMLMTLALTVTDAQQGTCGIYTGSYCSTYLLNKGNIYIPFNTSQQAMEGMVFEFLRRTPIIGRWCDGDETKKFICNGVFRPCQSVPGSGTTTIALPVNQCQADCQTFANSCPKGYKFGIVCPMPSSDPFIVPGANGGLYPTSFNTYNLSSLGGSGNQQVTCQSTSAIPICSTCGSPFVSSCEYPFFYRNQSTVGQDIAHGYEVMADTLCAMSCPSPLLERSQWETLLTTSNVVSTAGLIGSIFMIFTYGVLDSKPDRHTRYTLYMCISTLLSYVQNIFIFGMGWNYICDGNDRFRRQSVDVTCPVTGFINQVGTLSLIFWWAVSAFDLLLVIRNLNTTPSYHKYFLPGIYSLAIVFSVLPFADNQYAARYGGLQCFIYDMSWQLGTFWIPFLIALTAGLISLALIFREIYKVVYQTDIGKSKAKRIIKYNIKPFALVFLLWCEFMYIMIYMFKLTEADNENKMENYVSCVYQYGFAKCPTAGVVPFGGHFLFIILPRINGILFLLFYGLSRRTYGIWVRSWIFKNRFFSINLIFNSSNSNNTNNNTKQSSSKFKKDEKQSNDNDEEDVSNIETVSMDELDQNNNNNNNGSLNIIDISKSPPLSSSSSPNNIMNSSTAITPRLDNNNDTLDSTPTDSSNHLSNSNANS